LTHLVLDVHKDSISVAILAPEDDSAEVDKIFHDEASVRRLIARFPDPRRLVACYEGGPTGYELYRLLNRRSTRHQTTQQCPLSGDNLTSAPPTVGQMLDSSISRSINLSVGPSREVLWNVLVQIGRVAFRRRAPAKPCDHHDPGGHQAQPPQLAVGAG
jgi:hypothetical protein